MKITQYLLTFGLSAVKLILGLGAAVAPPGLTTIETYLCVCGGGIFGVFIYSFFGVRIRNAVQSFREKRRKGPRKINFKRLRFYVRVWKKYGLVGIAFLTPPLLSPPIGTLIAVSMGESVKRILLYMSISILIWGVLFAALGRGILEIMENLGLH